MMTKEELIKIVDTAKAEMRALTDEEKALIDAAVETRAAEPAKEEDTPSGETETKACDEPKKEEERAEEEPKQEETPDEKPSGETETKECKEEPKKDEERKLNNKVINNKMEKRFNLMTELRSALETGKAFNLNDVEARAYTVSAEGEDVVQTDVYDIWAPLRSKNVLVQAGAQTITGIKNNVQIPLMGAVSCKWASETGAAQDGSAAFTSKKLSPRRITAKYSLSLQLLTQDSIGVENAIRADIQKAINSKLEATLLGAEAGDDDKPAGLFYGKTVGSGLTSIDSFSAITNFEAAVEGANIDGGKYIISPKAKAALRNMPKSAKSTQLVMEGGQIDGTDAFVTTHVADKKVVYGDFANLVIATWDNVMIDVVRDTASVGNGQVTIVVNAFVDAALVRPEALVFGTIA